MAGAPRITVRVNGTSKVLKGPGPHTVGTGDHVDVPIPTGAGARQEHAQLLWQDSGWLLVSASGASTYHSGVRTKELRFPTPTEVHLGREDGPTVRFEPAPRRKRLLLAALVVGGLLVGAFVVGRSQSDRRPFDVGTCLVSESDPASDRLEKPRTVSCDGAFEHKIADVLPLPRPEAAALRKDERLIEDHGGRCPAPTLPKVPRTAGLAPVSELYCVRAAAWRIVRSDAPEQWCVEVDPEGDALATSCGLRHDYEVVRVAQDPSAEGLDLGITNEADTGCPGPGESALVTDPAEGSVLCLDQDNLAFTDAIERSVADLEAFWGVAPRSHPSGYTEEDAPMCQGRPAPTSNAVFCSQEDRIAWDERWLRAEFYDPYGDMAVATVLAHEWGHLLQHRPGPASEAVEGLTGDALEVFEERLADCYAGAWVGHIFADRPAGLIPDGGDGNKAIQAIVEVADSESRTLDVRDQDPHGDAVERTQDFLAGLEDGREECDRLSP